MLKIRKKSRKVPNIITTIAWENSISQFLLHLSCSREIVGRITKLNQFSRIMDHLELFKLTHWLNLWVFVNIGFTKFQKRIFSQDFA